MRVGFIRPEHYPISMASAISPKWVQETGGAWLRASSEWGDVFLNCRPDDHGADEERCVELDRANKLECAKTVVMRRQCLHQHLRHEHVPPYVQWRSKRSRSITLHHAATKSRTNFSSESSEP